MYIKFDICAFSDFSYNSFWTSTLYCDILSGQPENIKKKQQQNKQVQKTS